MWTVVLGIAALAAWAGLELVLRAPGEASSLRRVGSDRALRTTGDQRLVTVGPYRWVRHPGYLGSIAVWAGAALAFHNWLAALVVALMMALAYGWRIRAEERMLAEHFGDDYRSYAAHTARLLPGIY